MEQTQWRSGAKCITFIVTKDCQLACKYCYLVGKNQNERMSMDTARRAVDFILTNEHDPNLAYEAVEFDFIGGEPLLEVDLIDRICDYIEERMRALGHHWLNTHAFAITTNGINYHTPKVQDFIKKRGDTLNITITIDGTAKKHDTNRVWRKTEAQLAAEANGEVIKERGSYADVVRNIPLWLQQFPNAATKVTIGSADLPYVCESVLHLFSLGIHVVPINCVFEDVWNEGDDRIFEDQLMKLADAMLADDMFRDYTCTLFDRSIGYPMDIVEDDNNWCGTGRMLSIDASGRFYPCTRFVQYSLRNRTTRTIGSLDEGFNNDHIRPYLALTRSVQSSPECIECEVASGCAWCQGENYDTADSDTMFQRATAICLMHKARVRANRYFFERVDERLGREKTAERRVDNKCKLAKEPTPIKTVMVILDEASVSYCMYKPSETGCLMPMDVLRKAVNMANEKGMQLQLVYPPYPLPEDYQSFIDTIEGHKVIAGTDSGVVADAIAVDGVMSLRTALSGKPKGLYYILRTSFRDFCDNIDDVCGCLHKIRRLHVAFTESFSADITNEYRAALVKMADKVKDLLTENHHVSINILTDALRLRKMNDCGAGSTTVTLAPNGKFYICPAFYRDNPENYCGDIQSGIDIKNRLLYSLDHSPVCSDCTGFHCRRCVFNNKKRTREVNIPSYDQCRQVAIEMDVARSLYDCLKS